MTRFWPLGVKMLATRPQDASPWLTSGPLNRTVKGKNRHNPIRKRTHDWFYDRERRVDSITYCKSPS